MTTTRSEQRGARRIVLSLLCVAIAAVFLVPLITARPAAADASFDQKMLDLVNQKRAAAGLAPVQASLVANTIAGPGPYLGCGLPLGGRANDMGARNYFSHTILNCGGQSVFNILTSTVGLVYSAAGENIAWMSGTSDPLVAAERLTNDLMNSPSHRANILDPRFTHVGIGSWNSPAGQSWTGAGSPLQRVWIAAQVFLQMPLSAAPSVGLSPSSLAFGDRTVGTTGATQNVTVKNTGSAVLNITGTSVSGTNAGDFTIASNTCGSTVASGASCTIGIGFKPTAVGARSGNLTISDNAAGTPHAVALTGNGTAPQPLVAPTSIVARGGDGQVSVTWTPGSGPTPVGFGVFIYGETGYTGKGIWVCGTCTTATVTGLTNGKQYFAALHGHDGTGWGPGGVSNPVWALAPLTAPLDPGAVPGNASVTMTWRAGVNPGAGTDGYAVYLYDAKGYTGKSAWACGACTSAQFSGLTNGTSYFAVAYAHNPQGFSEMAKSPSVVAGAPGAPGNVTATKSATGEISLSWTAASDSGSALSGYGLWVYDAAGYTGTSLWVCATCTTTKIPGMASGKAYTVVVYGYNVHGWGVAGYANSVTL